MMTMIKITLTISALYLAAVGSSLMAFPLQFGVGAVPPDASSELIALLRLLGGPFLGIALLNWLSRDAGTAILKPVLLANLAGFGAVTANDIWGVATGEARDIAGLFLMIHLMMTCAFLGCIRIANRHARGEK